MKEFTGVIACVIVLSSCSVSKEVTSDRQEKRELKRLAEKVMVKQAVESRRYVIRVDKIYFERGGYADLVPRNNFIIVNGESTSVSLGYLGRSYGVRPISGINFNGKTLKYELRSDESKGVYNISMEVAKGGDKFDIYITVGSSGYCNVSLVNSYIQSVNYKGSLSPIPTKVNPAVNLPERL